MKYLFLKKEGMSLFINDLTTKLNDMQKLHLAQEAGLRSRKSRNILL